MVFTFLSVYILDIILKILGVAMIDNYLTAGGVLTDADVHWVYDTTALVKESYDSYIYKELLVNS